MKFFVNCIDDTYPEQADMLRESILESSILGPQKIALRYFQKYFHDGGTAQHPKLGNLALLVDEINLRWNKEKYGANLVSGYLSHAIQDPSFTLS